MWDDFQIYYNKNAKQKIKPDIQNELKKIGSHTVCKFKC